MITSCSFSICDTTNFVLDTGSPIHIYNSLQGPQVSQRFEDGERFLIVGDGSRVPVLALEVVNHYQPVSLVFLEQPKEIKEF